MRQTKKNTSSYSVGCNNAPNRKLVPSNIQELSHAIIGQPTVVRIKMTRKKHTGMKNLSRASFPPPLETFIFASLVCYLDLQQQVHTRHWNLHTGGKRRIRKKQLEWEYYLLPQKILGFDLTAEGNSQWSFVQRRVLMAPCRFSAGGVLYSPPDVSFILEHTPCRLVTLKISIQKPACLLVEPVSGTFKHNIIIYLCIPNPACLP